MTKLVVCATSCRCAFDLIASNHVNLYYKRHLDSNTVGYRYNAVKYIMVLELKSDFELTKDPVSHASYGVLLWCSEVNYIVITPSHCIWIFLKYNSLRSNDESASYIIIVEIMASHLLGARPLSKPILPYTYCQFGTWNTRGGLDHTMGFKSPTLTQFFLPTPAPLFPFFGYPAQNSVFAPPHPPPPIWHRPRPFYVKGPPTPVLTHLPKLCKLDEGIMLIFVSEKNRPLLLAKGVWKYRLRNVGSLGSASLSE